MQRELNRLARSKKLNLFSSEKLIEKFLSNPKKYIDQILKYQQSTLKENQASADPYDTFIANALKSLIQKNRYGNSESEKLSMFVELLKDKEIYEKVFSQLDLNEQEYLKKLSGLNKRLP